MVINDTRMTGSISETRLSTSPDLGDWPDGRKWDLHSKLPELVSVLEDLTVTGSGVGIKGETIDDNRVDREEYCINSE